MNVKCVVQGTCWIQDRIEVSSKLHGKRHFIYKDKLMIGLELCFHLKLSFIMRTDKNSYY